jgi:hypothetical protein
MEAQTAYHSSSVVRITGIAFGWTGATTPFGSVVRKPWSRWRPSTGLCCYSSRPALNGSGAGTIVDVSASSSWIHNKWSNIPTSRTIKRNNDARRKSITIAGSLGWEFRMNQVLEPSDECPHCRLPLEILSVKVGLRGTAMVYACTNCAMTRTQNPKQPPPLRLLGALRMIGAKFGQHSSSEASHELAIGVGAQESAHDAHDRFEGPTGTIGIVAQAEDA